MPIKLKPLTNCKKYVFLLYLNIFAQLNQTFSTLPQLNLQFCSTLPKTHIALRPHYSCTNLPNALWHISLINSLKSTIISNQEHIKENCYKVRNYLFTPGLTVKFRGLPWKFKLFSIATIHLIIHGIPPKTRTLGDLLR